MKTALKIAGSLVLFVAVIALGVLTWATSKSNALLSQTLDVHTVDFPIPTPLAPEEMHETVMDSGASAPDATALATERGRHLVSARYGCADCHGEDMGGGIMVDAAPFGRLHGPNLTGGEGSRIATFSAADWDRAVRHGVLPSGLPSMMPSQDFKSMSDQELSDIIVYIRSQPSVDRETVPRSFGPIGKILVATGKLPAPASLIDHSAGHPSSPPTTAVTVEFGAHLATVCSGCHGSDLSGGPIVGGDPAWPPARNITPHADGLAGWSYENFQTALIDGIRPDGSALLEPMTLVRPYAANMTDTELEALWLYLQSLPARETGG